MNDVCLCGNTDFDNYEQECFHIVITGEAVGSKQKFGRCTRCGIVRQLDLVFKDEKDYEQFYVNYAPTSREYVIKDWDHDLQLARQRCDAYKIEAGSSKRVLDVGCGSGAFVYECRLRGHDAFGCDIATYHYSQEHDYIYHKRLEAINFPVDHFDTTTCHDMLEHVLDPKKLLAEMFRITKQEGTCIIDYPRFFHESGKHHWKDIEHIWCLDENQLNKLLVDTGFTVVHVENPIESKVVIYCKKPIQKRKTILVPPGIGDSYWSVVRIESFVKSEKIGIPEVIPVGTAAKNNDRSVPFMQMFPFIESHRAKTLVDLKERQIWNFAYMQEHRTIWRNVMGCDYFLCWNGYLRAGKPLESIDSGVECNWHPKMFVSLEQMNFAEKCKKDYGSYIVFYFPFYGTYSYATAQFPINSVAEAINGIAERTGCTPIIAGAQWDSDDVNTRGLINNLKNCVDLTGKTSIDQLFGLLKSASAVVGYPSGLTVMSAVFYTKTLIIWNNYFNREFAWNSCPPDTRRKNYFVDFTYHLTSKRLINEVNSLVRRGFIREEEFPIENEVNPKPPQRANRTAAREKVVIPQKPRGPAHRLAQTPLRSAVSIKDSKAPIVMCVLKSGGKDFNLDYVVKLRNMIARHTTIPYRFVCLTDTTIDPSICDTLPLRSNLAGWWSKLELFVPDQVDSNYIVYFDLDTVIIRNIDTILTLKSEFAALGGWIPGPNRSSVGNFGSGMMVWRNHGKFAFLHDEFKNDFYKHGDQEYIANSLVKHGIQYETLQNLTTGIYSYKRNCLKGIPDDARVICFHGHPRPHQAMSIARWVQSYWR